MVSLPGIGLFDAEVATPLGFPTQDVLAFKVINFPFLKKGRQQVCFFWRKLLGPIRGKNPASVGSRSRSSGATPIMVNSEPSHGLEFVFGLVKKEVGIKFRFLLPCVLPEQGLFSRFYFSEDMILYKSSFGPCIVPNERARVGCIKSDEIFLIGIVGILSFPYFTLEISLIFNPTPRRFDSQCFTHDKRIFEAKAFSTFG
jgi:hypothetical protein